MLNGFKPIIDKNCKVLILGTMPSQKSLQKTEYYGNPQNKLWEIIYALFDETVDVDYEKKKDFLLKHHIALWDVLDSCEREGSSDSKIKKPVPNDFESLLGHHPNIKSIFFNGQKAQELFMKLVLSKLAQKHIFLSRLPSTSPAHAIKFGEKLKAWQVILDHL